MGSDLLKTLAVVYYDKEEIEIGNKISRYVDVRVVWGGKDAVEAIQSLEKGIDCVDIIFGPKYSFAIVDNNNLENTKQMNNLTQKLAFDISAHQQRGCNSPHTVFVEESTKFSIQDFCQSLGKGLEQASRLFQKDDLAASTVTKILNLRAQYSFKGNVYCSEDTAWTVLYDESENTIAEPCFGRTIFVRKIKTVFDVAEQVTEFHQSIGLAVSEEIKEKLVDELSTRGVARCPEIGNMSLFELPWDGMFPLERMVRWAYYD